METLNINPRMFPQAQCLYVSHTDKSAASKSFQMRYPVKPFPEVDKVIEIEKFNDLQKLLRVSEYVLRFLNNVKGRVVEKKNGQLKNYCMVR